MLDRSLTAAALGLALLASAAPAAAQLRLEIGPMAGFYSPTSDMKADAPGSPMFAIPGSAKHRTAFAYGGTATLWVTPRFGFAAVGFTGKSELEFSGVAGDTAISAKVTAGTATFMIRMPLARKVNDVRFGAGVAYLSHSGKAYKPYDEPTSVGAALTFGSYLALGERLGVDLGATALIYKLKLPATAIRPASNNSQLDFLGRVGVTYRLGGP